MRHTRLATLIVAASLCIAALSPATAQAAARRWIGYYQPGAPISIDPLVSLEARTLAPARVVNYFQNTEQTFTQTPSSRAVARGATPMVTVEFWRPGGGVDQPQYSLDSFTRGDHDEYLRAWAREAKAFGHTVWIRPFHEMNGNWYPWAGTVNGNSPADFVPAWNHVRDIFREEGATNVKFVWCPNIESIDAAGNVGTKANAISVYWPGADNVDHIALDGYNFGPDSGLQWRSFEDLFAKPYAEVSALATTTPIFVAETGCANVGGDKALWIRDMFKVIPERFGRIEGVCWFNAKQSPSDWRVTSTQRSVDYFVAYSSTSAFLNKVVTKATIRRTSTATAKRYRAFTLTGGLSPRFAGDRIRIEVKKPGTNTWTYVATRTFTADQTSWRMSYTPSKRGDHYFRARFAGTMKRRPAVSASLKVRVY